MLNFENSRYFGAVKVHFKLSQCQFLDHVAFHGRAAPGAVLAGFTKGSPEAWKLDWSSCPHNGRTPQVGELFSV
jgi:hypothetical protein